MAFTANLTSASTIWVDVSYEGVRGAGRVAPALNVTLGLKTPSDGVDAEAHRLALALAFQAERVSTTELGPARLTSHRRDVVASFPISARTLSWIGDEAAGDSLAFKIEIVGLLRVRRTKDTGGFVRPDIPIGEWAFVITDPRELAFSVPRGVWFNDVVSPISDSSFVAVEIEVPNGADTGRVEASLARLRDAERAWANGDDSGVFSKCRGAIEALPGYPGAMVAAIENPKKRVAVDGLLKEAGTFLHLGRHVSQEGRDAGDFPVDHRDASLALNMTRLLVAYVARQ